MMSFETGPAPQPGALTSTATLADAISRELIMLEGKSGNTRLVGSMEEILGDGAPVLTRSGLVMSATQALAVSTVFACRRVIAEDIASMRIEIGSAYTLVFFVVILPVLWGMQAAARWIEQRHGALSSQRR